MSFEKQQIMYVAITVNSGPFLPISKIFYPLHGIPMYNNCLYINKNNISADYGGYALMASAVLQPVSMYFTNQAAVHVLHYQNIN